MKKFVCVILSVFLAMFAFGCSNTEKEIKPEGENGDGQDNTPQINEIYDIMNFSENILKQEGYSLSEKVEENTPKQTSAQVSSTSVDNNAVIEQFKQLGITLAAADPSALKPNENYLERVAYYKLGFPFYFGMSYLVSGLVNDFYNDNGKVYNKNVKINNETARLTKKSESVRNFYCSEGQSFAYDTMVDGNATNYKVFKKSVTEQNNLVTIHVDIIVKDDFHISLGATINSAAYAAATIELTSISDLEFFFTDLVNKKTYHHKTQNGNFDGYSQPLKQCILSTATALKSAITKTMRDEIVANLSVADITVTKAQYDAAEAKYLINPIE